MYVLSGGFDSKCCSDDEAEVTRNSDNGTIAWLGSSRLAIAHSCDL